MRNLKKILSLALALVMVFSLMTFASAQDFNDAADIEYSEAVEVLTALEVIDGVGNNTFNPTGKVTRAQMAKMITLISLGNVSVEAFKGTTTDLTDISGHWAEAYIKYCYSQGIISGKGGGRFDPDANVTTAEAAKMLLVAIGYNSDVQVYEGPQWNINVIRDAQTNDIFDELALANDLQINRDQAAQMMYNALTTGVILKTSEVSRVDGSIIDSYQKAKGQNFESLLGNSFKGQVWVGIFDGNNNFKAAGNPAKGEIVVTGDLESVYGTDGDRSQSAAFPYDFDIANIGEEVKVIFKDGTMGKKGEPDKFDTIYGVYKTNGTTVVTGTKGTVKDQKSDKAQINIDGTKYDTGNSVTVWTNFNTSSSYLANNGSDSGKGTNSDLTGALKGDNGDVIKAIIKDGKISTIYVTTSKIAAVTAVNSEKVTMNNGVGSIEFEDNDVYDGIAKGDVVVVTTLYAAEAYDDDAYNIVTKAEVISGEVSGYKNKENVVVAGTTYKIYGKTQNMLDTIPGQSTVLKFFEDKNIGETADLFLVNGYVGAAVQTSESASNYSVIIDKNTGTALGGGYKGLEILVMDSAGVKTNLVVADDSKNGSADAVVGDFDVGDIVVWSGDKDDATVTIKGNVATGTKSYKEGTKAFDGVVTTSDCVLFVQTEAGKDTTTNLEGAKFKAYNIRGVKDFTVTSAEYAVATDTNNRVVAVFVNLKSTPGGATGNTVYGIVSSYAGRRTVNGTSYYQYTVQDNNQSYTLNMKSSGVISKGDLVYFDPASDEIYGGNDVKKLEDNPKAQAVYVDEYDSNDRILTFYTDRQGTAGNYEGKGSTKTYALDDDCVIVFVDVDGDKATSDIGINEFDKIKGYKNVAFVTETQGSDEVIIALLVETSNKADILAVADKLPDDADADDIKDQLDRYGSVTVEGDLPEGDYGYDPDDPSSTVEVVLGGESTSIDGESSIYGDAVVDSDVTLGASGDLTVIEMTLNAGKTLTITDGSTFNFRTINMKAGSEIEFAAADGTRTITFLAKADLSIYMESGYVKSGSTEIKFTAADGLNGALLAVNDGSGGVGSDTIGTWY